MEKDSGVAVAIVRGVRYTPGAAARPRRALRPQARSSTSSADGPALASGRRRAFAAIRASRRVYRCRMYEAFYGFREQPFRVTPDPRFLYRNAGHRGGGRGAHLRHRAAQGLPVPGRRGRAPGKTTLLRHLLDSRRARPRRRSSSSTRRCSSRRCSSTSCTSSASRPTARGKLVQLQRLNEFLLEHTRAGGNVALLIDEAQDLDARVLEELRLLSNLETGTEKILQILLAGQPELERKLAQPELRQLRQRITLHVRLRPLTPAEVAAYVRTRLERAGGGSGRVFAPDALSRIAEVTAGIPRLVNVLCDACLVTGFATERRLITPAIVDEAWSDYARLVPEGETAEPSAPGAPPPAGVPAVAPLAGATPPTPSADAPAAAPVSADVPPPAATEPASGPAAGASEASAPAAPKADAPDAETPTDAPVAEAAHDDATAHDEPTSPADAGRESPFSAAGTAKNAQPWELAARRLSEGAPRRPARAPRRRRLSLLVAGVLVAIGVGFYAAAPQLADLLLEHSNGDLPFLGAASPPRPSGADAAPTARHDEPAEAEVAEARPATPEPGNEPTAPTAGPAAGRAAAEAASPTPDATAADAVPAAAAAEPAPSGPPTAAEANALVREFRLAYEDRDVDRLVALFATDATENGAGNLDGIADAYRAAFAQIEEVSYELPQVDVRMQADRTFVRGPFVITYSQVAGGRGEMRGTAAWEIARRDGRRASCR